MNESGIKTKKLCRLCRQDALHVDPKGRALCATCAAPILDDCVPYIAPVSQRGAVPGGRILSAQQWLAELHARVMK